MPDLSFKETMDLLYGYGVLADNAAVSLDHVDWIVNQVEARDDFPLSPDEVRRALTIGLTALNRRPQDPTQN